MWDNNPSSTFRRMLGKYCPNRHPGNILRLRATVSLSQLLSFAIVVQKHPHAIRKWWPWLRFNNSFFTHPSILGPTLGTLSCCLQTSAALDFSGRPEGVRKSLRSSMVQKCFHHGVCDNCKTPLLDLKRLPETFFSVHFCVWISKNILIQGGLHVLKIRARVWFLLLTYSLLLLHGCLIRVTFCFLIFLCSILYGMPLPFLHLYANGFLHKISRLKMPFSGSTAKSGSCVSFVCLSWRWREKARVLWFCGPLVSGMIPNFSLLFPLQTSLLECRKIFLLPLWFCPSLEDMSFKDCTLRSCSPT